MQGWENHTGAANKWERIFRDDVDTSMPSDLATKLAEAVVNLSSAPKSQSELQRTGDSSFEVPLLAISSSEEACDWQHNMWKSGRQRHESPLPRKGKVDLEEVRRPFAFAKYHRMQYHPVCSELGLLHFFLSLISSATPPCWKRLSSYTKARLRSKLWNSPLCIRNFRGRVGFHSL